MARWWRLRTVNSSGWWSVFTNPGNFGFVGFDNYQLSFERADLDNAFINSVAIALPATFIPLLVAAFAGAAVNRLLPPAAVLDLPVDFHQAIFNQFLGLHAVLGKVGQLDQLAQPDH